ncbi:hypothetical protein BOTBODRAFT_247833 [Botryobasidium botryosum FD-172 SS1]|uniref:Uncharacterized protein n=1 Tax=Botryobasidium botryosum (strain FD-172 SS1) TaxID=930990 RepID=A0A067LW13_BOTB1|nr:hypothetical protein BOTBODRAFT_247833 [Botryobasidium botryosum FD-172 SS1]
MAFPTSEQLWSVEFVLCRVPLQLMHKALSKKTTFNRLLFPETVVAPTPNTTGKPPVLYNSKIATSNQQLEAITSILSQPPGSIPFIISGPPGTGKTITIVEAILQIIDRDPDARVLACAPSESAADAIAQRLIQYNQNDILRLIAPSRPLEHVPAELLKVTSADKAGIFLIPAKKHLTRFRIIVSTCVTASFPFGARIQLSGFTHIFVDDAGQAMEPEVMIPIKNVADSKTNVILSGDPKSLGPVIHSPVARAFGLGRSYLERLLAMEIYKHRASHGTTVATLSTNYRSHPAISRLPGDLLDYDGTDPHENPHIIKEFGKWRELVNRSFPVIFHGVIGGYKPEGQRRYPSCFNQEEISVIKYYVKSLRQFGLADGDIGIIAPYSAQCQKIRLTFKGASDIMIGNTEHFRGQERKAIIISTVRSNQNEVEPELRYGSGFLANPREFNASITRARGLLIEIGNPSILALDPVWRKFIRLVRANGNLKGEAISDVELDVEDGGAHILSEHQQERSRLERSIIDWAAAMSNSRDENE